ncbi:MAG: acyl-[Lachnospiraceae bacterium]|nr:acyl-[acyl-carrier-protein] thioesterase [Lachnospiraceae bacterium]
MFEMKREVTYSQVRRNLKLDMAEIAQFFQDCVLLQSETIGKGVEETERSQTAWYLSSWQIEVERYPEFMEEVTVRTWPHEFKSMYGYRNFDIIDSKGKTIARANSIWIFMDLAKMRPSKPTEENIKGYVLEPALDMEYAPRKINILGDECKISDVVEPIVVKYSFLDSNNHVNNGRYVKEAMDYILTEKEYKQMRVDYRKAATLGDKMYPIKYQKEDLAQLVFADKEGNPYVVVEVV